MNDVINTDELKEITGYVRSSDVEKCLESQDIRFFRGKDGPWTTLSLINAAKGLTVPPEAQTRDIL